MPDRRGYKALRWALSLALWASLGLASSLLTALAIRNHAHFERGEFIAWGPKAQQSAAYVPSPPDDLALWPDCMPDWPPANTAWRGRGPGWQLIHQATFFDIRDTHALTKAPGEALTVKCGLPLPLLTQVRTVGKADRMGCSEWRIDALACVVNAMTHGAALFTIWGLLAPARHRIRRVAIIRSLAEVGVCIALALLVAFGLGIVGGQAPPLRPGWDKTTTHRVRDFLASDGHLEPRWVRVPPVDHVFSPLYAEMACGTLADRIHQSEDNDPQLLGIDIIQSGYPFRCLERATYLDIPNVVRWTPWPGARGGLQLPDWPWLPSKPISIQPIWSGLVLNTLLYSTPLLILTGLLLESRRMWRERRHRCPTCGYDRVGLSVCPECGAKESA